MEAFITKEGVVEDLMLCFRCDNFSDVPEIRKNVGNRVTNAALRRYIYRRT